MAFLQCRMAFLRCRMALVNSRMAFLQCRMAPANSRMAFLQCRMAFLQCRMALTNSRMAFLFRHAAFYFCPHIFFTFLLRVRDKNVFLNQLTFRKSGNKVVLALTSFATKVEQDGNQGLNFSCPLGACTKPTKNNRF